MNCKYIYFLAINKIQFNLFLSLSINLFSYQHTMNPSQSLSEWYSRNKRDLPWRNSPAPYEIWLSEIILQQTRVDQGLDYFNKFISHYPDIHQLAAASVDEVLKLWQGLGYYTRARNLHAAANEIVKKYNGRFPESYNHLIKLKGIGPYTAAAVASIAFNEPVPVVDGNVLRFLSRYYGINVSVDTNEGKKKIYELAASIIDTKNPGVHNQAVMEFGALQCKPHNPECEECIFKSTCYAYKYNKVNILPVKNKKTKLRKRFFNYLFITCNGKTYLNKRNSKDIWRMLYEFPLVESDRIFSEENLILSDECQHIFSEISQVFLMEKSVVYRHHLSHQLISAKFFHFEINEPSAVILERYMEIDLQDMHNYAIPRLIEKYLESL